MIIDCDVNEWPAHARWTRERLIAKYGDVEFGVSFDAASPYRGALRKPLGEYLSDVRQARSSPNSRGRIPILFTELTTKAPYSDLMQDVALPDLPNLLNESTGVVSNGVNLTIMADGGAVALHAHGATWNALLYGRKVWYLMPPKIFAKLRRWGQGLTGVVDNEVWNRVFAIVTSSRADAAVLLSELLAELTSKDDAALSVEEGALTSFTDEELKGWQVLQEPGSVLYVPYGWGHSTLGYGETVSVNWHFV
jgi:hypothetical protein